MTEHIEDHVERVRMRRAPKFSVFLLAGAAVGVLVAMIVTFAFSGTDDVSPNTGLVYTQGQVFGFMLLVCIPVGLALAGILALILDRRSAGRTKDVIVDHLSVRDQD
jgi:H+/Cl- antiporter ClcA